MATGPASKDQPLCFRLFGCRARWGSGWPQQTRAFSAEWRDDVAAKRMHDSEPLGKGWSQSPPSDVKATQRRLSLRRTLGCSTASCKRLLKTYSNRQRRTRHSLLRECCTDWPVHNKTTVTVTPVTARILLLLLRLPRTSTYRT